MSTILSDLRATLITGMRLSMQGSYNRRAPAKASLPYLSKARSGLRHFVNENPANPEAWRLLAQAEECFLDYGRAIACLEKAVMLSATRNKSDLKRLALLREYESSWHDLRLSPEQLRSLGQYLETHGAHKQLQNRSMALTTKWLEQNEIMDASKVLTALNARGAFSDFQVFHNVICG